MATCGQTAAGLSIMQFEQPKRLKASASEQQRTHHAPVPLPNPKTGHLPGGVVYTFASPSINMWKIAHYHTFLLKSNYSNMCAQAINLSQGSQPRRPGKGMHQKQRKMGQQLVENPFFALPRFLKSVPGALLFLPGAMLFLRKKAVCTCVGNRPCYLTV